MPDESELPAEAGDADNIRIVNKTISLFMVYLSLKVMFAEHRDISTILGPTSLLMVNCSDFLKSVPPAAWPRTKTLKSCSPDRILPV